MKTIRSLIVCCMIIIVAGGVGAAQQPSATAQLSNENAANENHSNQAKLSLGAQEVANILGIRSKLDRLYALSDSDRGLKAGPMSMEALTLREEILESIISASLTVDG